MSSGKKYLKALSNVLFYLVCHILLITVVPKILVFFLPFIIGWIISAIANPAVRFLEEKIKFKRKTTSAIAIILILAIVISIVYGIGYFLNVHEGPQSIHWNPKRKSTLTPLKAGMVVTDEPGIYIEGKYGIRIENDLLAVNSVKNEYGQFMKFEALTLCPYDLRPVNFIELSQQELNTLKAYHNKVLAQLSSHLNVSDLQWLKEAVKIPE